LQAFGAKRKRSAACGGFAPVTASNRHDETSILGIIDRYGRIGAKQIGHNDVTHLHQSCIVGAGEFSAGIAISRHIVQADGHNRSLADIHASGIHTGRNRSLALVDFTYRENIKSRPRGRLDLNRIIPGRLGTGQRAGAAC
jgi:hypothetical protein